MCEEDQASAAGMKQPRVTAVGASERRSKSDLVGSRSLSEVLFSWLAMWSVVYLWQDNSGGDRQFHSLNHV